MTAASRYALVFVLLLTACADRQAMLHTSLDRIRVMVKQSAALAAQAACMPDAGRRADMVHAAVALARRAMGGPEMAKIHRMMNMRSDKAGGAMSAKVDAGRGIPSEIKMHMALHDAGEEVFDFLDAVDGSHGPDCADVRPVSMAAAAAVLREAKGVETLDAAGKLDRVATAMLNGQGKAGTPEPVRKLVLALQRI